MIARRFGLSGIQSYGGVLNGSFVTGFIRLFAAAESILPDTGTIVGIVKAESKGGKLVSCRYRIYVDEFVALPPGAAVADV